MSAYYVLIMLQIISLLFLAVESAYIFMKWKNKMQSYLLLYCVATLLNNVGYLFEMLGGTSNEALIGTQIAYMGKVYIPLALVIFVLRYCELYVPTWFCCLLAGFHTAILLAMLSCKYHTLFYSSITWDETGLFPHNVFGHGPVYFIYIGVLMLYFLFALVFLTVNILKEESKARRSQLGYLLLTGAVDIAGLLIFMTGKTNGYDTTSMAFMISTLMMFICLFKFNLMDTTELVKDYAMDNLSEAIIAIDNKKKIIYYNEPAVRLYPKLAKGKHGGIVDELDRMIHQDDILRRGELIYSPHYRELRQNGAMKGQLIVLDDITESFNHTLELQKERDVAEEARQAAEDANASKSAFLSVVSHEIRTPMNAVVGMTELLLRDELTSKQRKYMENIKNSGAALVMIVNDILDQSKIEAGKMEIVEDTYELSPLLNDVRMIIENRLENKPINLELQLDDDIPPYLIGDSLRIRQILINLMNNAVKFTEQGYIRLVMDVVSMEPDRVLLRFGVKDSGQGIKPEDLSKLGEAFTQVDTKKNHRKEGTGLGLSISRDFISMMGGQLEVDSVYGEGSEFHFTIYQGIDKTRIEQDTADAQLGTHKQKQAWQKEHFTAPDAHILIVDDNSLNLIIAEELLEEINMHIDTSESGEEAIKLVASNHYDVVFMDYMMPYMDGIETTGKIRAMDGDYYKNLPIIALTGDTSEETYQQFVSAGINDFTEKPVDIDRLKTLLLKWLPEDMIQD